MEFGQNQMQVALSLVLILGAALVALMCDLLKGNNEQLRELALELKVRREEEDKRFQMLSPHAVTAPVAAAVPSAPLAVPQRRSETGPPQIEQTVSAPKLRPASVPRRPDRRERRPPSPEAMAAIQRGEQLAASPRPHRVPEHVPAEPGARAPFAEMMEPPATPAAAPVRLSSALSTGATRDWGSVLQAGRQSATTSRTSSAESDSGLPAGFQDGFVLTRLVEAHQPISGLVVSIGVSTAQETDRAFPADVRALIQSLIGPRDFAVQSAEDEFLLIYPGERGASTHRRLAQIAEQLWDFQLCSMGSLSILFSWGGVEVNSESIDEAIASATERMQETRRNRRVLTMEPRAEAPLRRAV